jgi:hypothetical protein
MVKRVAIFSLVVCLLFSFGSLRAEDLNPPDWRGQENTTYQQWEFGDDSLTPPPDYASDPYPLEPGPVMAIPDDFPDTAHLPTYLDMDGVWRLESPDGEMLVTIQNFPDDNLFKYIWMQITYSAKEAAAPLVLTNPGWTQMVVSDPILMGDHWYVTYDITLEPNPPSEVIVIQPNGCTTYIDEIVIDTICIPEPATLLLLGLGGLALLKKRIA